MTVQEMAKLLKGSEQDKKELKQELMGKMENGIPLTQTELSFLIVLNGE